MRAAAVLLAGGALVMAGALVYGFGWGEFRAEGSVLLSIAWGRVSLIDVYVGFFLFSGWIAFREPARWRSAIWILLVLTLGNLLSCIYGLLALRASGGDWRRFWMGDKA